VLPEGVHLGERSVNAALVDVLPLEAGRMKPALFLACGILLAALLFARGDAPALPSAVAPAVKVDVQPFIDKHAAADLKKALKGLARADQVPALFKTPLRDRAARDPWAGLTELEQHGLALARTAQGGVGHLPALLDRLSALLGRPAGKPETVARLSV